MKHPASNYCDWRARLTAAFLLSCLALRAQSVTPNVSTAPTPTPASEPVELSPFTVNASSNLGYQARETLGGSRLNTQLKDVASQVSVMTQEFIEDLAITNLDDAFRYSLNGESAPETIQFDNLNNSGNFDTNLPYSGSGRTRSLSGPNRSHDFFDAMTAMDAYNTERITFASGPNAILFGNASPGGAIDVSFKRAELHRMRSSVSFRADSLGGDRLTVDLNQPIVQGVFAVRFAGLRERTDFWREPALFNQDRAFGSFTLKPLKQVVVRGWYEAVTAHRRPMRNVLAFDHVSPWIEAGRPAFNNGSTGAFVAPGTTSPFIRTVTNKPLYVYDETGRLLAPVGFQPNTVVVRGYDTYAPGGVQDGFNLERTLIDRRLYPVDINLSGNAVQSQDFSRSHGAIVELNPLKNLYFEFGFNEEYWERLSADYLNPNVAEINVDANQFLNDRVTPNPNYGRYFVENIQGGSNHPLALRSERRASVSYELNFTQRPGWQQWLGRHRVAGLLNSSAKVNGNQISSLRIISDPPFTDRPAAAGGTVGRNVAFRQYLPTPGNPRFANGSPVMNLPFDPLTRGAFTLPGTDIRVASFDNPLGELNGATGPKLEVDSKVFAMQNFLLKDRVVVTYGRRSDKVDSYATIEEADQPRESVFFLPIDRLHQVLGDRAFARVNREKSDTGLIGVVVHPLRWLSAFYNSSDSQSVPDVNRYNLDGSPTRLGYGTGKDYGVSFSLLSDRLSIRINKYENTSEGSLSGLRNVNPTPTDQNGGNSIKQDVFAIERSVLNAGGVRSTRFATYHNEIVKKELGSTLLPGDILQSYDVYADGETKGIEVSVVGNPTPQWRLSASFSKGQATESNIATEWFDFIRERLPVWAQYLNTPIHSRNSQTVGQLLGASISNFNYIRLNEGRESRRMREYRALVTTRYGFSRGRLNGAFVGANYRWVSRPVVGYPRKTISDNPFVVPGLTAAAVTVDDLEHPTFGRDSTTVAAFAGYGRRLFDGKVMWRVQLNVNNVLDEQRFEVQRALPDGRGAFYTLPDPRVFILTNTFSF